MWASFSDWQVKVYLVGTVQMISGRFSIVVGKEFIAFRCIIIHLPYLSTDTCPSKSKIKDQLYMHSFGSCEHLRNGTIL